MRFQQTHNLGLRQLFLTVSWDLVPCAVHLTVPLYLCSSGSNARGESRALEGCGVISKSPSRFRDGDEGVAGRSTTEMCFPDEESFICFPGKWMILLPIWHPRDPLTRIFLRLFTNLYNLFFQGFWRVGRSDMFYGLPRLTVALVICCHAVKRSTGGFSCSRMF